LKANLLSVAKVGVRKNVGVRNMSDQIKQIIERMEQLGPAQVRLLVASGNLPSGWEVHAVEWLAKKDQEERAVIASSQAEQIEIARSASKAAERASDAAERQAAAAERANRRATIALIIAVISVIATIVGMVINHIDALRPASH
jgi:hypothetical protein